LKQVKRCEEGNCRLFYAAQRLSLPVLMDLNASYTLDRCRSALVTAGREMLVSLVREKQRNTLTGSLTHIDFQVVSMKEKIRTRVSVETRGEAPAVKNFNGILVLNIDELEIEALPGDLPERILVDVSGLETSVIHRLRPLPGR
jgi:large subunit ribosomal protein L25